MTKKVQKNQTKEQLLPIEEIVPISDLGCAAALQTASFELIALDRQNPYKIKFVFRREAGIEKVADDFWANRLEQKSRSFWDNVKALKNKLYSNE